MCDRTVPAHAPPHRHGLTCLVVRLRKLGSRTDDPAHAGAEGMPAASTVTGDGRNQIVHDNSRVVVTTGINTTTSWLNPTTGAYRPCAGPLVSRQQ